jgi:ligand-binding sensor domain-containing protein
MGSDNYGIIYIIDGQIGQVLDNTCSACNYVHGITQTADGRVWFGTNGGLKVLQGDELTLYTTADGLADNNVQSLAVDDWDNLWIGCRQGAFITRYSNGEFEKISLNNDASSLWVTSIAAGKRGDLWFGMVSYGLTKYDGAVMDKIYKGPADDTITKIFKDSDGNLWFGTLYGGVSKYITE